MSRLQAAVEARDAENSALRAGLEKVLVRLELKVAELERRLSVDSTDSGTPASKERIGAKEARRARQQSERERRKDRKRGGQPGHQGKGIERDPEPDEKRTRSCRPSAAAARPGWKAQGRRIRGGRRSSTWR